MLAGGEERLERVVAGNHKASNVGQKLAAKVENDKEKVKRDETDDSVGFGDGSALLEVVQSGVLGQLESGNLASKWCQEWETEHRMKCIKKRTSLSSWLMYC